MEDDHDERKIPTNHGLVALNQRSLVDQTLVDVELRHVVDDHGTLEVLLCKKDINI